MWPGSTSSELTGRKFSNAKAETILRVARMVVDGSLVLERHAGVEDISGSASAEVSETLLAIKGIGPWTVNYVLLRGYGYPDCSLEGDVAVRAALHKLSGQRSPANRRGGRAPAGTLRAAPDDGGGLPVGEPGRYAGGGQARLVFNV